MSIGWLLDASVVGARHEEFVSAIHRQGDRAVSVCQPRPPYTWDDVDCSYRTAFHDGASVVTYADIDLVLRVQEDRIWNPGAIATINRFHCSHYFPHYGRFLLNGDYIMLPFGELTRRRDFLFDSLQRDGRLFLRPDSPLKPFAGTVVSRRLFDHELREMTHPGIAPESLVVVSSPKEIISEWRFVVAEDAVVAGCRYAERGRRVDSPAGDQDAMEFGRSVAAACEHPDPVWIADVCRTADGQYRLLEIGAFSFSSLYSCDLDAVVRAVSSIGNHSSPAGITTFSDDYAAQVAFSHFTTGTGPVG